MTHAIDPDDAHFVCDVVEHSIVTDPDAPVGRAASELFRSWRPRIGGEAKDGFDDATMNLFGQLAKILFGSALDQNLLLRLLHEQRGSPSVGGTTWAWCGPF